MLLAVVCGSVSDTSFVYWSLCGCFASRLIVPHCVSLHVSVTHCTSLHFHCTPLPPCVSLSLHLTCISLHFITALHCTPGVSLGVSLGVMQVPQLQLDLAVTKDEIRSLSLSEQAYKNLIKTPEEAMSLRDFVRVRAFAAECTHTVPFAAECTHTLC